MRCSSARVAATMLRLLLIKDAAREPTPRVPRLPLHSRHSFARAARVRAPSCTRRVVSATDVSFALPSSRLIVGLCVGHCESRRNALQSSSILKCVSKLIYLLSRRRYYQTRFEG